ncbi:MAG: hypothetical protein ABI878_11050 [Acidobacteriota bacterium]
MKFAKYVFLIGGIYGLLALLPLYFMKDQIGVDHPPAITHAEFFYGFVGVAVAFQIVFLIISLDPVKYRLLMLASVVEKFSFAVPCTILFLKGLLAAPLFAASMVDGVLGVLFIASFVMTRRTEV